MNFKDYMDSVYMSTNIQNQKNYTVYLHAKSLMCQSLVGIYRSLLKPVVFVELLGRFIVMKLGLSKKPELAEVLFKKYHQISDEGKPFPEGEKSDVA